MKTNRFENSRRGGFALVVTIALMVLLTVIAVGMLTLSAISMRTTANGSAQAEAQANARLALMLAIGELQKEMGPDMRVTGESALFDQNPDTETIDGVAQSHWLASYNSWGGWLNDKYTLPSGGGALQIQNTYTARREPMFRRWLLSLPQGMENDPKAPLNSSLNDSNSVILVGEGSLGKTFASNNPDKVTRAYLTPLGKRGKQAWWISPENQKARIDRAKSSRTRTTDEWQVAQGDTAEVGVGALSGFQALDADGTMGSKLITRDTLRAASVAEDQVKEHFFDLTAQSQGVIASVRTGHLKKDLSLLFEKSASQLSSPYKFNLSTDIREPSIRPMSNELKAKKPQMPNRHFASWTNMLHYYRMYRSGGGATSTETGKPGILTWSGSKPSTDFAISTSLKSANPPWNGSNHYWRAPILAKLTLVYSLKRGTEVPLKSGKYECLQYYSPVFTFWNPYNTELVVPSGAMSISSKAYRMWPTNIKFYLNGVYKTMNNYGEASNFTAKLTSGGPGSIVFKPGELKVFSMKTTIDSMNNAGMSTDLIPGFDPAVVVGDERKLKVGAVTTFSSADKPGAAFEFSCAQWGGGVNMGNTPGAMFIESTFAGGSGELPMTYSNDWLQRSPHKPDQTNTAITPPGVSNLALWNLNDNFPKIVAYAQMAIKGMFKFDYLSIDWEKDWRSRNWIQAPPFYFGSGMYMSLDDTIAHTQRLDCPYIVNFGETSGIGVSKIVGQIGPNAYLGSGAPAYEQVTSAALLELPTAPISSLAGFANMRINPGWLKADQLSPNFIGGFSGNGSSVAKCSLYAAESKRVAYQSGVTGPGIGNSFMHPMLPRNDVYRFIDNSKSRDVIDRQNPSITEEVNTKAYCDYWDHVLLLNDTLWDDYFVSSLADQKRGSTPGQSLSDNFDRLVQDKEIPNSRYRYYSGGKTSALNKADLQGTKGFEKAAKNLMVDGMFNVNSTSVAAWQALFAGIRERQLVFRDNSGSIQKITVPSGKRIALSRFDTEVSDKEMGDAGTGAIMPNGSNGWSGVRFLEDAQLTKLAEECVKQVKKRGPFLNFSEFINRRLSNDDLGTMGALQSAIDYDDKGPDSQSINYRFKAPADTFMIKASDLGTNSFATPEAAVGSRLAGIPGYVIQSDLLKPIANTLAVRDDTFRIRAYGESIVNGKVVARAWCEAVVQRVPEYQDPVNEPDVAARLLDVNGAFSDNAALSASNIRFGRKFRIESFRWLNAAEI